MPVAALIAAAAGRVGSELAGRGWLPDAVARLLRCGDPRIDASHVDDRRFRWTPEFGPACDCSHGAHVEPPRHRRPQGEPGRRRRSSPPALTTAAKKERNDNGCTYQYHAPRSCFEFSLRHGPPLHARESPAERRAFLLSRPLRIAANARSSAAQSGIIANYHGRSEGARNTAKESTKENCNLGRV